jgi:hypothetical protein
MFTTVTSRHLLLCTVCSLCVYIKYISFCQFSKDYFATNNTKPGSSEQQIPVTPAINFSHSTSLCLAIKHSTYSTFWAWFYLTSWTQAISDISKLVKISKKKTVKRANRHVTYLQRLTLRYPVSVTIWFIFLKQSKTYSKRTYFHLLERNVACGQQHCIQ